MAGFSRSGWRACWRGSQSLWALLRRDCSPAPAAPSSRPRWQLSHPVSRFLSATQAWRVTSPYQHGSTLCLEYQTKKKVMARWLQMFPITFISSCMCPGCNMLWCSVTTSVSGGKGILAAYEFEKALLNLLLHCIKVQRSSALQGLGVSNNSELWNTDSRTEFKLHTFG